MKTSFWPALFGALAVVLCGLTIGMSFRSRIARSLQKGEPIYGLILGTDWVDNARHADAILYVRYDPNTRKLDLLSIPRDTRVSLPHLKVRRINEVYAYAYKASKRNPHEASTALWEAVSYLLFPSSGPVAAPPLHFYAQIDYDGFKSIIDLLGGADVQVEEPMHYDDNWGKLHIHFSTGFHRLDGQRALEYVRYRGSSGDYGRVCRQQEFLLEVLRRFTKPASVLRLPKLISVSLGAVQTNLSAYERLLGLYELRNVSKEEVRLIQLPGKAGQGYWIPDEQDVRATSDLIISGRKEESDFSRVTIEVWNASSQKDLAQTVMRRLRNSGFDVVKWGNYASRQQKTFVRDHRGDARSAQAVVKALKSGRAEVFTRVETHPLVDVEVILGEDFGVRPDKLTN